MTFDVVVVGAGHAGCEAAAAAARLGRETAVITFRREQIGRLSCNPAIGGQGKGQLVREIDALGGWMGRAADATCIQFRRLNTRKGLAVQASRAQVDIDRYPRWMAAAVAGLPKLTCIEGEVASIEVQGDRVVGVRLADGSLVAARAVVLTTGTFLAAVMHRGAEQRSGGRVGEAAASRLSGSLASLGLRLGRLKTGTVPRLDGRTVRWDLLRPQLDVAEGRFSYGAPVPRPGQIVCYEVHTTPASHEIIRRNLHASPLFTGAIVGRGPRYCPSIEDKVTRFADRDRHLLFLEPEGLDTHRVYVNGLSTSLPAEVQEELIHSLPGLEQARIEQYGYAVEYDFSDPTQLGHDLQVRDLPGLYLAGQVNGTSGYEEAAGQGLIAGVSAALGEVFHVKRSEGYLGVLVDDLVTRGVGGEPYRMFTSRAEHRLLLREDNADLRLMPRGRALGLVDDDTWSRFERRAAEADLARTALARPLARPEHEVEAWLRGHAAGGVGSATTGADLLRRPQVGWEALVPWLGLPGLSPEVWEQVEIDAKYAGYIDAAERRASRTEALDGVAFPPDMDWGSLTPLSTEVRERLARARPETLAAAARVPGVTAAALSYLAVWAAGRGR